MKTICAACMRFKVDVFMVNDSTVLYNAVKHIKANKWERYNKWEYIHSTLAYIHINIYVSIALAWFKRLQHLNFDCYCMLHTLTGIVVRAPSFTMLNFTVSYASLFNSTKKKNCLCLVHFNMLRLFMPCYLFHSLACTFHSFNNSIYVQNV